MIGNIVAFSVRNKFIVLMVLFFFIGNGIYQITKLPIDAVPDITDNQVQIITTAPSLGALDIERLVTFPVEMANSNIPGIHEMRSFSRFGLSLVTIVFEDNIDVYWARQQVMERLQQISSEVPSGVTSVTLAPVTTGLGEIYQYSVRAAPGYEKIYSQEDLRTIQDWIIRRQLLGVKGVADVSSFGGKLKQFEIKVNSNVLYSYGLSIQDVLKAVTESNENTGGSYIEKGPTVLYIRTEGLLKSIDDIKNTLVKESHDHHPIFVRDIAEVSIGSAKRYGAMIFNDEGEVAGAVVMMLKGENSNQVIQNVKERIEEIKKTIPKGIIIEPFLDRTKMVKNAIATLKTNLLEGALIVLLVLVFFLSNIRAGLIVASVIPLSLLFAVTLMNLFGVSGNLMSLGALDFGLIVDGAVIIVEALLHYIHQKNNDEGQSSLDGLKFDNLVINSTKKMLNSSVFGQIIILIVYLPIFTLRGIEGKMFIPMAQTVTFALLGAFILSLTYVPMISAMFLKNTKEAKATIADNMMIKLENIYEYLVRKVFNYGKAIIISIVILFACSIWVLTRLGGEFIPALEEGDFAVDTRVLIGSNIQTSVDFVSKAAGQIKNNFPEVEQVVAKIGSGEIPTDPMPMEAADMMVILKPKSEWTSAKSFDALAEKMAEKVNEIPGITVGFQYPVQMRFNELMTGAKQDVVCKLFGENLDSLEKYAQLINNQISSTDGASDLFLETVNGLPQIIITPDKIALARFGLTVQEFNQTINCYLAGQTAGSLYENEKRFDIIVKADPQGMQDISDINNLLIQVPNGNQVPLFQLAHAVIKNGPNQIQREDAKRRIIIGFNAKGKDVESLVAEIKDKIEKKVQLPPGYFIRYGGAFKNLEAAKARLGIAVPVALLLIFILLYLAFNSMKLGLLIFSAVPLSAIGGILFLWLRGMPFSISAGIGFIALFGVAVLNGIVLIAEFNHLKSSGMKNLIEIVIKGSKTRLRPILMTASVASLGFLPMAISTGSGAEVQKPLATVVIGGLVLSTFLTLFLLPLLYVYFDKKDLSLSRKSTALGFLLFFGNWCFGQNPINYPEAHRAMLKNDWISILQKSLELKKSMASLPIGFPETQFNLEAGQINSNYFDNKIGITQYLPQRRNQKAIKELKRESVVFDQIRLNKEIRFLEKKLESSFLDYSINDFALNEYMFFDSILHVMKDKASNRVNAGQDARIDLDLIGLKITDIRHKIKSIQSINKNIQNEIAVIIGSDEPIKIAYDLANWIDTLVVLSFQTESLNTSAIIGHIQKMNQLTLNELRSSYRPRFGAFINSGTIKGVGADDITYDRNKRFMSAGLALEIKLDRRPLMRLQENSLYENKLYDSKKQVILKNFDHISSQLKSVLIEQVNLVKTFRTQSTKITDEISTRLDKKLKFGDINFLEWFTIFEQTFQIKLGYIESLHALKLNYLQSKYLSNNYGEEGQ